MPGDTALCRAQGVDEIRAGHVVRTGWLKTKWPSENGWWRVPNILLAVAPAHRFGAQGPLSRAQNECTIETAILSKKCFLVI